MLKYAISLRGDKMTEDLQLMKKLSECGHILHHRRCLNQSQNQILLLLYQYGSMSQSQLMEMMHIQSGSLSELVSKVERAGYIQRNRCEHDCRNFEISLTDTGEKQAVRFEEHQQWMAQCMFEKLDLQQKKFLYDMLEDLLEEWKDLKPCHSCKGEWENA